MSDAQPWTTFVDSWASQLINDHGNSATGTPPIRALYGRVKPMFPDLPPFDTFDTKMCAAVDRVRTADAKRAAAKRARERRAKNRLKPRKKETEEDTGQPCWVDLSPYLSGDYTPPVPDAGRPRGDGKRLLYAGRWHTLIALTAVGKTWFGLAHVAFELQEGRHVVVAHFEEASPAGTVARLMAMGVPPTRIATHLHWVDLDLRAGYRESIAALDPAPSLIVLDGINAACGSKSPNDTETVEWYRATYVVPATGRGAAVLSLGHPPKDVTRQGERHGFGSTAWLDLADGVGFRMEAGKPKITKGERGSASLFSVKDRYGGVEEGEPDAERRDGWKFLGTLVVDDTGTDTEASLLPPAAGSTAGDGGAVDGIDRLADRIVEALSAAEGRRYESERALRAMLREAAVKFRNDDLDAALLRLERTGRLQRGIERPKTPRPGWLTDPHDPN